MTKKELGYFQPIIEGKLPEIKNTQYKAGKMKMVTKKLHAWR